jgi:hypothetical protein
MALMRKAEQGAIRDEDEVDIKRHTGHARARLHEITSPQGKVCDIAGQPLCLALVINVIQAPLI